MAATTRPTSATLEEDLLLRGHEFSFFQAMRLLGIMAANGEANVAATVRVRPELSLAFPAADVAGVERFGDGYLLTATFLGLYGQASPLPTFYTEDLLEESAADLSANRDFLDIANHRLFTLFYECITKYQLFFQVVQEEREAYLERLFCLIGLGDDCFRRELPDARSLLRYCGLLAPYPRSALGLTAFLADALGVSVTVVQCLKRRVSIPEDQQLQLGTGGCTLGVDAVLGTQLTDRAGKFRIQLGPLDRATFTAYLPGTPGRHRLDALVGLYVTQPLSWDLELKHVAEEVPAIVLGSVAGGRLGWDSWLAPDRTLREPSVIFPGSDGLQSPENGSSPDRNHFMDEKQL
jgi:type VI secretion system protein ImpH